MGAIMGRKPSVNHNLLPHMRARKRGDKIYFFFDTGGKPRKEISLGSDFVLAVRKWSDLNKQKAPVVITLGYVIGHYMASDSYQKLATGTQGDYKFALDKLSEKFSDAPIDQVDSPLVQLYMDDRSKETRHRALREVSILSMVYRYAMARGWVQYNPVAAVRRERLPGRQDVYTEDEVLAAVYQHASDGLKDALDIAYLVGQRPIDCIRMTEASIKDLALATKQTKRGVRVRVPITGDLELVINRIIARKRKYPVQTIALLIDENGRPMTKSKLRSRFEKARTEAGEIAKDFQFRDLRAKAATDVREAKNLDAAQALMGHASSTMTEHYTRNRKGKVAHSDLVRKWK
jgi:integrase